MNAVHKVGFMKKNKQKQVYIYISTPSSLNHLIYAHVNAKGLRKVQKVPILKRTTVLCHFRSYYSYISYTVHEINISYI